ncbi:Rv3654c family TadE-like protein [Corynebacterium tapiri]|uniref:TadE-like protein n=1 Tax=Corynebacterium tapiri TaxID=1448266 RepID=A0A5C4U3K8_9CORY|nr:Rv3654c family TadE-like protein [Corynebacterium tapiri]TNL97346.1 TadE-like protein [Corynebacterium tapiri]
MRNDHGNATIAAVGIIAALAALTGLVAGIATLRLDTHQARLAADLTAVAAAERHVRGEDGCSTAVRVAELNHARLEECVIQERDVQVTVAVRASQVSARAGPLNS